MKQIEIEIDGINYKTFVRDNVEITLDVETITCDSPVEIARKKNKKRSPMRGSEIFPPIAGKIVDLIPVGKKIKKGDVVATIEAMKMYNRIFSPVSGIVKSVNYSVGDNAVRSTSLVIIEKN